jgi:hypothetical protein
MRGLPVTDGDGACLVQQQGVQVAGRLYRLPALGDHIGLQGPVHPRDADSAQQPADGRRDQADKQRYKGSYSDRGIGIVGKRFQRDADDQEDQGEACQQYRQGDLIRRLLPRSAFYQRDHLVEKALSRIGGDPHLDLIAQHLGTTGDAGFVAAGLPDDGSALARDGALIYRRQSFDDLSVHRDGVARLADEDIALPQLRRRDDLDFSDKDLADGKDLFGRCIFPCLSKTIRLGLAPRLRDGFRKIGKQHGDKKDEKYDDVIGKAPLGFLAADDPQADKEHHDRHDIDGEHDWVTNIAEGFSLTKDCFSASATISRGNSDLFCFISFKLIISY